MRNITFNKKGYLCIECKKNRVDKKYWNKPCDSCKGKEKITTIAKSTFGVSQKIPAAVVKRGNETTFVDKFGNKVEGHNYDLENDPRGWGATGRRKESTII